MTTFSRKKIRGFYRKLQQLDDWKNSILSFPTDNFTKPSGQIFRIHLKPFYWYGDKNPHFKFHGHIYKAYADILQKLKDNEFVKHNKLIAQLWLFYPRTISSIIIVASHEQHQKRNGQIDAKETSLIPPKLFGDNFNAFKLKIGSDNVFELVDDNDENTNWLTRRQGDIWTVE